MDTAITERPTRQSTALPSAWIDRLFERLGFAYGTEKFAALWRGQNIDDVKAYWASELAAFSGDELRRGLDALRRVHPSWPPTLYEFADLCRPPVDAVHPELAFHEAIRGVTARREGKPGQWSSKAVYWAAIDVSAFDLLNSTWPQMRVRWTQALEKRMADGNLPAIPEVPKALPAPEHVKDGDSPRLDALRQEVGKIQRSNPLAWADRLLQRHADGDKTVDPYALKMAQGAHSIAHRA